MLASKGAKQHPWRIHTAHQSPNVICCSAAYKEETRKMILTLNHVSKTAPNGKQILKDVGLGMYLGAKIGFLGANGTHCMRPASPFECTSLA